MAEPIGYATLQIIPSLKGVSESIDKQLGGLTVSGKRAGAQFGKGVADGLKATESDVKRATDAYQRMADKAKDSLGAITVAEAKLQKARTGGKTDMIVAAEERLAKVRRDSLRSSKEAEAAHSALIAVQGRLGSGAADLGGRFSGLSTTVAGVGSALGAAGAIAGGAALVGITALAAGAVRATKELYDLGASFDDLRDKLQISTGASGAQLEGLVATVEKLGTTTVASKFADIGAVAADVTRNLHLTGPALEDVTSRLANWDRMTGDAINVRELSRALHGFKVEAQDQGAALNMLAGASQASGFSINELLTAVNKGGSGLREFGFSLSESAGLVIQLNAAGLDAEKMLKGPLNKALVELRKEGKTGADGLRGIVDQIQALLQAGDQLGARKLAEDYFGTKGATDFFDAIKNGNDVFRDLSTSLQATSTDINKLAQDTADGAERFTLLRSRIEKALAPIGATVFDTVNDKLDQLATWVETHQPQIINAFVTIGDAVISMATGTLRGLGEMTEAFGGFISILGDVQGAVLKLESAQARWRGDTAQADELHKQSEEAFGWGENLQKLGRDMKETARQGGEWKKGLRELGEEAKNAAAATATLNRTVVDGQQVFGPFVGTPFISGTPKPAANTSGFNWDAVAQAESSGNWSNDNTGGHMTSSGAPRGGLQITDGTWKAYGGTEFAPTANLASKEQQIAVAERIAWGGYKGNQPQGLGAWEVITQGKVPGVTANTPRPSGRAQSSGQTSGFEGLTPAAKDLESVMRQQFPQLGAIGGVRPDSKKWHPQGLALDLMIPGGTTRGGKNPQGKAFGDQMWAFLQANAEQLGVDIAASLWQTDQGGDHFDHIHAAVKEGLVSRSIQDLTSPVIPGAGVTSPIDLSRNTLGAAGPGTPGFDEEGKPGFWKADPKAVREADERAADAVARIADADAAVAMALARINELDADASESQKLSAQEALRKAQQDTDRSRREARDAQADLEEAKKGKFTAEKEAATQSSKGFGGLPSLTSFSGIGGALGEFAGGQIGSALDVFGVGDSPGWLQAVGQFMGGISIGGQGGGSLSPLSALGQNGPAPSLGGQHAGTGQQPGPGVTYNITNGGGNDDLITLLRRREQEIGAMLGRY